MAQDSKKLEDDVSTVQETTDFWDLLPLDIKVYILARTNLPTLFSMRLASKDACRAVTHCLLSSISAPTLLSLLPIYYRCTEEAVDIRQCEGYRNARFEMLKFQKLARLLNLADRWRHFTTLEQGVMALLTVPHNQLNPEQIKDLVYGGDRIIPSEFVESEMVRLELRFGKSRVNAVLQRLHDFERGFKRDSGCSTLEFLKVKAVMYLRASDDAVIQDGLISVEYAPNKDISFYLLELLQYAKEKDNARIIQMMEWLVEAVGDELERKIERLSGLAVEDAEFCMFIDPCMKIKKKIRSTLVQQGCWDRPVVLMEFHEHFWSGMSYYNRDYNTDYTVLSCALLLGWEKGFEIYMTIRDQTDQKNAIIKTLFGREAEIRYRSFGLSGEFRFGHCFINHSGKELDGIVQGFGFHLYDNFSDAIFVKNPQHVKLTYAVFDSCWMDNVIMSKSKVNGFSFKNMKIKGLIGMKAVISNCTFERIHFIDSIFDGTVFDISTFRDCQFSSSVSFSECRFGAANSVRLVLFERCLLSARQLHRLESVNNVRFINCEFHYLDQLPSNIRCYETDDKDAQQISGRYQLFKILEKSKDYAMIERLQADLYFDLKNVPGNNRKITLLEDSQIKEILSYEMSMVDGFLRLAGTTTFGRIDGGHFRLKNYQKLMFSVVCDSYHTKMSL